jgi:hypothetical protein
MMVKENTDRCWWCNANAKEAEKRHEGPHATWCPYYVAPQRPPPSLRCEQRDPSRLGDSHYGENHS